MFRCNASTTKEVKTKKSIKDPEMPLALLDLWLIEACVIFKLEQHTEIDAITK